MLKLALKALWDGSFTFSLSPITSHMEKVFAKKLGFYCIKRTKFLILDKVELISCPLDYFLNLKNPTPPKLRFVSPPRKRGGDNVWDVITVGIITDCADMILDEFFNFLEV
ncbi:hypothetical protein [Nostoc flagelliforme]|uniref:hypothetical protein n=1 Tax=Nostoc flagelliforme TaxID=1306274 RepID=UPI000C2D01E3